MTKKDKKIHQKLLWENLKMRIELEVIAERPDSRAAKKILDRYRRKMAQREEALRSLEN
jgi:hypothetical protein